MDYPAPALHVAGRWITRASGGERPVIDPATGKTLAMLPLAGPEELGASAEAALRGFHDWRGRTALYRCHVLRRAGELIRERADQIAACLVDGARQAAGRSPA